ncbi:hypothetical protein FLA_2535 [Filimonas lacunae]|nr:hypothetical protein FLA_2535 [Filimonas lacunae]
MTFFLFGILTVKGQYTEEQTEQSGSFSFNYQYSDSTFAQLKEAYSLAVEKKDQARTGKALMEMGNVCYNMGNIPKALDLYGKADKIFREEGMKNEVAQNLNATGAAYYHNRQSAIAREKYNEALTLYQETHYIKGQADTYGKIGHLYEKQKKYDSAFYFQRLALQEYTSLEEKQGMAGIYENIGSIYEDLEQFDSSLYYYNRSYELYIQAHEPAAIIGVLNNLGDVYRKTGRYAEAMRYSKEAFTQAQQRGDLYETGAACRDLGKTWYLMHQPDSAYRYLELSRRASIDIYSIENNRQAAFLSALFEADKKNEKIVSLEHERNTNIIIAIATVIVLCLLIILGRVTISRQRLKIKNADIVAQQHQQMHETQQELMQSALTNKELQEDKLRQELELKVKELTSHTLHVIQKNQLLDDLRTRLEAMAKDDKRDQRKQIQQLIQQINLNFNYDEYWNEFRETFEQVHQDFFAKLKKQQEDLTHGDLRLAALIKLNLSSKDMATLLAISQDSLRVSRYRLRKKLNLEEGESLTAFLHSI